MTREAAALEARRNGCRVRHVAAAAGVDRGTLYRWLKKRPDFAEAYRLAEAEGVQGLISQAKGGGAGSGQCLTLLQIAHGYHHSRADKGWEENDEQHRAEAEALREVLRRTAKAAPHLLREALDAENREPV